MSLERYRCPHCDQPVAHSGEICGPCQSVICTTEALDASAARKDRTARVVMIREALLAVAGELDTGEVGKRSAEQTENLRVAAALTTVAVASADTIAKLGRLLK